MVKGAQHAAVLWILLVISPALTEVSSPTIVLLKGRCRCLVRLKLLLTFREEF